MSKPEWWTDSFCAKKKNTLPDKTECSSDLSVGTACTHSLASHTLHREEGSGHAATIELSPWQKLDVTNQIRALCRLHPLSRSTFTSQPL